MTTTPPSDAGAEAVLESLAAQVNKQLDMSDDALFGYLKAYGNPKHRPTKWKMPTAPTVQHPPRTPRSKRRSHPPAPPPGRTR